MELLVKFGPKEVTREQRQELLDRMAALNATHNRKLSPLAEQLSQRYDSGVSLEEITELLG